MPIVKYKNGNVWASVTSSGSIATNTTYGYLKVASDSEVEEGTDNSAAVTPKTLKTYSDNHFVHKTGNETITGVKTFTEGAFIKKQEPLFGLVNTTITKGTAPSSVSAEILAAAYDNNGLVQSNKLGQVYVQQNTNGGQQITMACFEPTSGSTASQGITIGYDGNKNIYTYAPTPSSVTDNTTKIATTEWVIDVLEALYPVGSLYIGTQNSCPLSAFFGTWTLVSAGSALWTGNGQAGSGTTTNANYANAAANTTIAAGLPNITGNTVAATQVAASTFTGAFQKGSNGGGYPDDNDSVFANINFNASRCSSIYGTSTTVQPPAYVVNVWRRTA